MNPHDDHQDEELLIPFLKAVERDMASPDPAFLERLRAQSTKVYQQAFIPKRPPQRRRLLFGVGVAAALLIAIGTYLLLPPSLPAVPFAKVLENTAAAGGLHLKVTDERIAAEAWVRDGRLRLDRADGTSVIARGAKVWVVNEKDNRVTPREGKYFRGDGGPEIDVLTLLGLRDSKAAAELLQREPAGRVTQDGKEYLVYRTEVLDKATLLVEILVQLDTLRLAKARAWFKGQDDALAELAVVGYGEKIDEERFVVKDTLTEDGRVGKIAEVQGVVSVRPVMAQRWTPVGDDTLLRPGDWVRTDVRGANAARLRLAERGTLILGPGTLVEILRPDRIRVHHGEIQADAPPGKSVEFVALDGQSFVVKGKLIYRIEEGRVVRLDKEPGWLKGFTGAVPQESLGSLLAKVDGRNVPLSVGYHKVTVDVRDQIARTTIEESFVNHTDAVLEGVFHFPLPQDASISGFGMWIGDNLVEADVVEKQRAREIYETILTEKRDPGLLEWTGGNIFKARVYPIPGRSEKRVKITYTQVLPLRGGQYRYAYALQSEMLRQHPLRQLDIDVKVHSALPLRAVTCPTHTTRSETTDHSAHVEFSAQEYTPTRDFEVVVEVDAERQPEVVAIPHRRGDDGYFLVQILPPAPMAGKERGLLPDGAPLRLLVLADTSASMDTAQRARQAQLLAALLGGLTPRDSVNLACCDVDCDWAFEKPQPATPERIRTARQFLSQRVSLGWTDLDKAFASAFQQCEPGTHVLYVGDGIVTTGDADPASFARRLQRLYHEQGKGATCHAVALGSSFEPGVLQAIASLGGGSSRQVSGAQGPVGIAREWLEEAARPVLRDLKVQFKGLRTARVYPEKLPNLPAGSQQIVLGRYLPEGKDQRVEVVVTGRLGDKPVEYSTQVSLKDAEEGNSFIPRLWARMHLDVLLAQGNASTVRDEVIALSEEYQIITPYTSLLVLESDADRARFGVKRGFHMRDGEKYFTAGRDNANYELMQKQMKQAGTWRQGLRRQLLRQLATLGRNPQALQLRQAVETVADLAFSLDGKWLATAGQEDGSARLWDVATAQALGRLGEWAFNGSMPTDGTSNDVFFERGDKDALLGVDFDEKDKKKEAPDEDLPAGMPAAREEGLPEAGPVAPIEELEAERAEVGRLQKASKSRLSQLMSIQDLIKDSEATFLNDEQDGREVYGLSLGGRARAGALASTAETYRHLRGMQARPYLNLRPTFDSLFPPLPPAPRKQPPVKSSWPKEARELAQSLLRTERLAKQRGGIEVLRQMETFDAHRSRLTQRSQVLELVAPGTWLTRAEGDRSATLVNWCDGRERGVFSLAFQLGRVRAAAPDEAARAEWQLNDFSLLSIEEIYHAYTASLEQQGKNRVLLVLRHESTPGLETRFVVDTERKVLLSHEERKDGKVTSATTFDDFVEVAGCWWARKEESRDGQARLTSRITQTVRGMTAPALQEQISRELAARERVQLLHEPLPSLTKAKRALKAGKAGFDDRLVLLWHFAAGQRWARALEHLDVAATQAAGKPGRRWLRTAFLGLSRRHEELKERLLAEAETLAKHTGTGDAYALAEYVFAQGSGVLPAGEMMVLLDRLRPVYEAAAPQVRAMLTFQQARANYLHQLGHPDEAMQLRKQLAIDYPDDAWQQRQYAQMLANTGDFTAAYAWLKRVLTPQARWLPEEEESLRNLHAALLEQQGLFTELAEYLAGWVQQEPASSSPYLQYLSILVRTGQIDKASDLIVLWLREGQAQGKRSPVTTARLQAAIAQAVGRGHNLWTDRVEERWLEPLSEAALVFARRPEDLNFAQMILQSSFGNTDAALAVRKKIAEILDAQVGSLSPVQIQVFVREALTGSPAVPEEVWKRVAEGLRKRWSAETKPEMRNQLGHALVQVLTNRATPAELIAFLHKATQEGPEEHRAAFAQRLFDVLLAQPWSAEYEDEALALLGRLSANADAAGRLREQVAALYRLTDAMIEGRYAALMAKVEHPEKLTRTQLKQKEAENRKQARAGFADRLRMQRPQPGAPARAFPQPSLAPWLAAERLYLEVLTGHDPKKIAAECWTFLGKAPPAEETDATEELPAKALDRMLQQRFLTTLAHLACRKDAEAAEVARLLEYVERGVAGDSEDGRWKLWHFRLLVALDRPKELETALRQWDKADDADSRWRVALAYLLAEQGRLGEAVTLFEALEKSDELSPAAYRALADWYLVLNRRTAQESALLNSYKVLDEYTMSRLIGARLYTWQRAEGHAPSELDREVLLMFAAIFEKSSYPANYLGQLQQFYQSTRDFRLLAVLADAVVGHSPGKVYPFLQGMQGIITDIHEEATVDELCAHLAKVRERAKTAVDRRALDLLEAQVRRRAAELKNQAGPHTEAALAALRRAFDHPWSEGEPRLMADLLAALGTIGQAPLAAEQLRQLEALHRMAKAGTSDRLHIAHRYAATLWIYGRRPEATDQLTAALQEFQDSHKGVLPIEANEALAALVSFHAQASHHALGEKLLRAQLEHPAHRQQARWLTQQLYGLFHDALRTDGEVSLGKGQELYQALQRTLRGELATDDADHRYQLVSLLCRVYRSAAEKKREGVKDDLRAFAFQQLAEILRRQTNSYDAMVNDVAHTVHDLLGPADAVAFLLDRDETEPAWLRFNNQDGWSRHSSYLAQWRAEAKELPPLVEARLLALVVAELRRDLETRQYRNRALYHRHYGYYWQEKEAEFVKVAEAVLVTRGKSAAAIQYLADYLSRGVNRHDRAIDILLAAHKRLLLEEPGQEMLVQYLHEARRFADSIPILLPLVQARPENLGYRVLIMRAYFHAGKKAELLAQLQATDAFFHDKGRWNEGAMASLGNITLETALYEQATAYFKEAIGLHERTAPRRGVGDGVLSSYYGGLARAYSGLHRTLEAVEAAGGAIVSWGPDQQNRTQALAALLQVVREADDLDAFVAQLDRQEATTGLVNPIVHKAAGQVYAERGKHREAVTQLKLAAELRPDDAETRKHLVAQFDALHDADGAFRALLDAAELSRRDIKLYQEMGRRLEALGRPREVERAYTSIVEMLPNESEGHALLAEIRQSQNRWADAILHWEQVARIRALEPTGLLKLAAAQVHERQWEQAAQTVKRLRSRGWPARFNNLEPQVHELELQIEVGRKAGS
jgi:tetratricopeptide (TPR) repeat protein